MAKSDWHYKPLSGERIKRLEALCIPHLQAVSPGKDFLDNITGEQLAELLSIVIDKPIEWIKANYSVVGAVTALVEFSYENLAGKYLAWTATGEMAKLGGMN